MEGLEWVHMDKKLIELEYNQQWCVEQIRLLNNKVDGLENELQRVSSEYTNIAQTKKSVSRGKVTEISFTKKPDQSFLGLSKTKAYCTVIPKSTVDQNTLLTELGINRDNKQTQVLLIDCATGITYPAQIRCAYQDRNKTRKLAPEDLKPDIRILLEFKKNQETCEWFCLRLKKSIAEIENGENASEKISFQYIGQKKFEVNFE